MRSLLTGRWPRRPAASKTRTQPFAICCCTACMPADVTSARCVNAQSRPRVVSTTRPTTAADPIRLLAAAADLDSRALWMRPATGDALVGLGSAAVFHGLAERVAADWRRVLADSDIDALGIAGPRLLG